MKELKNILKQLLNETFYNEFFIKQIAEKSGINISRYNMHELMLGFKAELEHGKEDKETNVTNNDPIMTLKIAIRHLKENPNYYSQLQKTVEPELSLNESKKINEKEEIILGENKRKFKVFIKKGVNNIDEVKLKLIKKFLKFCCDELNIDKDLELHLTHKRGDRIKTTASYSPTDDQIWTYVKNRNMLADILRSIAHEIRHYKQKIDGVLIPTSGNSGSKHENEAHCFSGKAIRMFGELYPEIFI